VEEFNATAVYTADAAAFKGYTKSVVVSRQRSVLHNHIEAYARDVPGRNATPSTGGAGHGRTVARAASRAPHRSPVVVVFGDRMAQFLQYLSTQFLPREINCALIDNSLSFLLVNASPQTIF
jgi:hypothetical protein